MYEVDYNGRTSYAKNYFYVVFDRKKLLCDAERDLLATVKFLVIIFLSIIIFVVHMRTDR